MVRPKYLLFLLLITLLVPFPTGGDKIQVSEEWQYIDSESNTYNETAVDTIQWLEGGYDAVALSAVSTDRLFSFPTSQQFSHGSLNLTIANDGVLYVTQEGGIPLFGNHTFTGTIVVNNDTYDINGIPEWYVTNDPATALATANSINYDLITIFGQVNDSGDLMVVQRFVISTDQAVTETTRNYTITQTSVELYPEDSQVLTLSQSGYEATKITWNSEYNVPTYVGQSEPAKISSLSLSQSYEFEEYYLSDALPDESSESTEEPYPFILLPVTITLAVLIRRRK